jgi:parallel beta-helix repeat protein
MSQSHRISGTTGARARHFTRAAVSTTATASITAVLLLLATACSDSTAPVSAARPVVAATTGLITVAPSGLATAPGTMRAPMTLEQAVAMAPAGSTIQLQSGTYQTGGLVITRPLTIRSAPGANVKLTGSVAIPAGQWQSMGNTWRTPWSAHGIPSTSGSGAVTETAAAAAISVRPTTTPAAAQEVENEQAILVQSMGGAAELAAHQHMAFVDGHSLQRVSSVGEVGPGSFFVDTVAKWLYIGQSPGGHVVEASAAAVGMLLYTSNIRVTGITLSHFSQIGLRIQGTHVQVDHNTLSYNGQIGLDVNAASNALVQNNTMTFNGEDGMLANAASGVIVENNNFSNNNTGNYSIIASAAGIKVTTMTNFIFRGNWVADNSAIGVWIDVNSVNSTVVDNQVLRNPSYGIYIELGNGIIIAGNTVHDNTRGIGVHFTSNANVYNNTMVNNGLNLDASASYDRAPYDLTNAVIVNNIMSNATTAIMENLYRYNGCNSTIYKQVDYNAYYRSTGSVAKTEVNWCNDFYTTMTAFHAGTGYEAHGLEIDGGADPFFVNAGAENYHLHSGSVAIGRGEPLPANIAAALGWRAGVKVSLGSLQN